MQESGKDNIIIGQAAVYRVASELLLRGHLTSFPSVDLGFDLSINNSIRIQVKSTGLRSNSVCPEGGYWFRFRKASNPHTVTKSMRYPEGPRVFSKDCDFVILVGRGEWRFWIIPAVELDNVQSLLLQTGKWPDVSPEKIAQAQKMHDDGLFQQEIGDKLGMSQMTVSRILRGRVRGEDRYKSQKIMKYENQWELLDGYIETIQEVESILKREQ